MNKHVTESVDAFLLELDDLGVDEVLLTAIETQLKVERERRQELWACVTASDKSTDRLNKAKENVIAIRQQLAEKKKAKAENTE